MGWQKKALAIGAFVAGSSATLAPPAFAGVVPEQKMEWRFRMTAVGAWTNVCNGTGTGPVVKAVQANLWAAGNLQDANGIDGIYAQMTHNAMRNFQAGHLMADNGCLNFVSWDQFQNANMPGTFQKHFIMTQDRTNGSDWKFRGSTRSTSWSWDKNCQRWFFTSPYTGYTEKVGSYTGVNWCE